MQNSLLKIKTTKLIERLPFSLFNTDGVGWESPFYKNPTDANNATCSSMLYMLTIVSNIKEIREDQLRIHTRVMLTPSGNGGGGQSRGVSHLSPIYPSIHIHIYVSV